MAEITPRPAPAWDRNFYVCPHCDAVAMMEDKQELQDRYPYILGSLLRDMQAAPSMVGDVDDLSRIIWASSPWRLKKHARYRSRVA